jgi:hypothetical protein
VKTPTSADESPQPFELIELIEPFELFFKTENTYKTHPWGIEGAANNLILNLLTFWERLHRYFN